VFFYEIGMGRFLPKMAFSGIFWRFGTLAPRFGTDFALRGVNKKQWAAAKAEPATKKEVQL